MDPNRTEPPDVLPETAQTMAVLEAFSPTRRELSANELAQRAQLPLALAQRIAFTLCASGHLHFDATSRRYRLGATLIGIVRNFLGTRGVRGHARSHMEALAARFRSPVALSERDALEMLYLEYVRGDAPVVVQHRIGTRLPLATSASGRAWLAAVAPVEAEAVRGQLAARFHREWPTLQPGLAAAQEDLARLGFTRSYGEMHPEVNAVAVPMRSPIDGMLLVFSLAAPAMLVPARRLDTELGPALVAMAGTVLRELAPDSAG